jgi:WD40 repeat protein/serine/threonine protein kinase
MDHKRWLQMEELLQQALDLQPQQRAAFLEQAVAGDAVLLGEVEALLRREEEAGSFMESPAIASLPRLEPPSQISHYRIEKQIGSGGMGDVFSAYDETLRRVVALKMLPVEFTSDAERVRRFEQEAFAASRLNHPNIITIFEITRAGDSHFIVEEIVEGRTLRDLLRDPQSNEPQSIELERALDIAIQIVRALKAAHTAWIIHRDIKPENVMVRDDGLVKVLDFGIAKLDDDSASLLSRGDTMTSAAFHSAEASLTIPGAIMGTTSYMSPEQARGEPLDGRTDLFSLGIVLYEMVTGVQLFSGATQAAVLRSLKESNGVVAPDLKARNIPKELQRILRRALHSERELRYASAGEFLEDLTRVKRRLESRTARRIVFISALTVVVALTIVGVAAFLSVNETWEERMFRDGHTAAVRRAVFSPDGKLLVSVGEDHNVIVWDFARRMRLATLAGNSGPVTTVAFSPDGKWFVTGSEDQTAILWNVAELKQEIVWNEQRGPVLAASFSPDASQLVYSTTSALILRDAKSWTKEREIPGGLEAHGNYVFLKNSLVADNHGNLWELDTGRNGSTGRPDWIGNWLALAPDGKHAATLDADGYLKTFDLSHPQSLHAQHAHSDHGRAIEYSPDGKLIASGAERVLLWDASTMTRIAPLEYDSIVWSVAFSPDGRWLVSTHGDGSILIWDVVNRELEANLRQHSGGVRALAFSPDGKRLASASEDQSVILWDAESGQKQAVLTPHHTRVGAVAYSPDGTWLVSSDQSGDVIRYDSGRDVPRWIANVRKDLSSYCVAISPDGRLVASSFAIYAADTGAAVFYDLDSAWRGIYSAAFTKDGTKLLGVNDRGFVVVMETGTWRLIARQKWSDGPLVTMSLSPDDTQIVTGEDGKTIRLGTIVPLRQTAVIGQHSARVKAVAFSPDGKQIASAGDDKVVVLWDVNRRKRVATIGTHTSPVYALAFSPDGRRLMTGEHDRSVRQYTRRRSLWGFSLD